MSETKLTPADAVARIDIVMSHAWMVRTFVKHSTEVEDFPELMEIVRTVFDTARALETRAGDPPGFLHMLRKKIGKLRQAAEKFGHDAPLASDHTNFKQAVISIQACVRELDDILQRVVPATPPAIRDQAASDSVAEMSQGEDQFE